MPSAKQPQVSVLVLGYNSRPYLEEALSSILGQKGVEFEVLFVDNASNDGSLDFVRRRFPSVRVISSHSNLGYAGGNNLGAKEARGECLAIVNPDVVAPPGWLAALHDFAKSSQAAGQEVIACSKVLLASEPSKINSAGVFLSSLGFCGSWGDGEMAERHGEAELLLAPTGCSFIIRRDTFLSLGGFDEKFFMYAEDLDLGWRAANRGIPTYLAPDSRILHKYVSFPGRPFPYHQTARNQLWAIRKNYAGLSKLHLIAHSVLFYGALALAKLVLLQPGVAAAILSGVRDGLFSRVSVDSHAGGPGRSRILGPMASLSLIWGKIVKHSK